MRRKNKQSGEKMYIKSKERKIKHNKKLKEELKKKSEVKYPPVLHLSFFLFKF